MADNTKIEWTDATWNPITGCTVHSPGCTNCYAMKLAGTRLKHHWSRQGLTIDTKAGPVWNGEVRFNEEWLDQPLRWKRPRMIFVCAHADLFHAGVPNKWIDRIFVKMARCPQHIFQVLTKRSDRMFEYLSQGLLASRIAALVMQEDPDFDFRNFAWPLRNVWPGVSVEDQERANQRVPDLIATPAWVRWVSAEPLLGPIDFTRISTMRWRGAEVLDALTGQLSGMFGDPCHYSVGGLDWIVAGGESGENARACHPEWAIGLRDQCTTADVPFLWKQWGEWKPFVSMGDTGTFVDASGEYSGARLHHFPDGHELAKVGKKAAGRLLDGVEHNGFPA